MSTRRFSDGFQQFPTREEVGAFINGAFPEILFKGPVTEADGNVWSEELDDDLDLWQGLRDRCWTTVPGEFIDRHASDLPLLTSEAFAAFLPAWAVRGLNNLDPDNRVLEHTVYSLSPGSYANEQDAVKNVTGGWWRNRIALLTSEQLDAMIAFVEFVANDKSLGCSKRTR